MTINKWEEEEEEEAAFFNFGRFYSFILWFVSHLSLTQHSPGFLGNTGWGVLAASDFSVLWPVMEDPGCQS